ncbi:23S rRNA methyltransferase [Microbacterium aurum]|uniref:23S rRNA methyltransferase n=1 Tax=Microbacterium aurum TaxID=36805 RepID=A0A1P8U712_9MICO|nr:FAD-dependent oxidoreductase [Microbacterium aurum]APZ33905.1 23S rRNA methyltransferase [Microbacterium aurum]MBM7827666.1 succinate dehydrogenase/fumarate reductase flavoprotein subunit [Microbacterium aurum]
MTGNFDFPESVDFLVIGAGAAGLASALVAADNGLRAVVLEKTEYLGGTTAYSAGTCWMPGHSLFGDDADGDRGAGEKYLDALVGDKAPKELRQQYLAVGPTMLERLSRLGVTFRHSRTVVDYHPELPGAGVGRALEPEPFDGRTLGRDRFSHIRPPVPEFALFGGSLMVRRAEVNDLMGIFHASPKAVLLALRLGWRWLFDILRYPRGTRLTMGNALVGTLYYQLLKRGGEVRLNANVKRLLIEDGRVSGAVVESDGREQTINVTRGVVLAGGGFAAGRQWRERLLPKPTPQYTRAAVGASGETLALGVEAGGVIGDHGDNAFWFPSSVGTRRDGSLAVFPHIWDRAKPGIIAVAKSGRRFVDESVSYHRFTRAMYDAQRAGDEAVPAWLVLDQQTLRRYGLGLIRPMVPAAVRRRYVRQGYIIEASSIAELAERIGVDPAGLEATVRESNVAAADGLDKDFGKGSSSFGLQYGDPQHRPSPNLGPISRPPYYALAVVPTPLSTAAGLKTDKDARVVDATGQPIPGLYACGNDADSVMAAEYPGAGCQVGAGLTFGFLAAQHATRK